MECVMDQCDFSILHGKYYNFNILNVNGSNDIDYDSANLELLNVENFKFIVHKNDTCVADSLRIGILFEKFVVSFVKNFINPTKNIIDLGANIGTHSIIYSNYTKGNIYSFEPQKIVFDILQKNIELNNCKNIIPYNFGGSNVNNIFYMNACYDLKDNQGAFCIDKSLDETNGLKIQCKIIDELNIQNVGYIKIDVEGHEYEALLGMEKIISRDKPTIMIEIHDNCITKNDTFLFFEKIGYKKYYKISHCDYIFLNSKFEVFDKINNIY